MGGGRDDGSRALTIRAGGAGSPAAVTGTRDLRLAERLVSQVAEALWLPAGSSEAERVERIEAAVAALKGLAPRDEMEGMLAAQMVATHGAAMECLRRATRPDSGYAERDLAAREANLRQAGRLLSLYARQVETLNRNRGKGQQKVTVEHVHIEAGGQAIVGQVSHGGSDAGRAGG